MKYHYTYRITNILKNLHYYGVRSSTIIPNLDIGYIYFSSSSNKNFIKDQKENPQNYKYKVIKISKTREQAIELEIKLHNKFNVGLNENFYNKSKQTASGWDNIGGYNWPKKSKENVKGITTYKDKSGNTFRCSNLDSRVISRELVGANKDISYKDNLELIETRRKAISGSKNPSAVKIEIYNNHDELMYTSLGNFNKTCIKNNLPFTALHNSYLKDTKLYMTLPKHTISKLKGLDLYKYKGWYAKKV